jgi:hypothetical protein
LARFPPPPLFSLFHTVFLSSIFPNPTHSFVSALHLSFSSYFPPFFYLSTLFSPPPSPVSLPPPHPPLTNLLYPFSSPPTPSSSISPSHTPLLSLLLTPPLPSPPLSLAPFTLPPTLPPPVVPLLLPLLPLPYPTSDTTPPRYSPATHHPLSAKYNPPAFDPHPISSFHPHPTLPTSPPPIPLRPSPHPPHHAKTS